MFSQVSWKLASLRDSPVSVLLGAGVPDILRTPACYTDVDAGIWTLISVTVQPTLLTTEPSPQSL